MSSTKITVTELIAKLHTYPQNMYVVLDQQIDSLESYEGYFDGPQFGSWQVIPVRDVRSGMNHDEVDPHWDALLIR